MSGNVSDRVYLYGLDEEYNVVRYEYIEKQWVDINALKRKAEFLLERAMGVTSVYAIDNSFDVYHSCQESMRTHSIESRVIFKIMLEEDGVRII